MDHIHSPIYLLGIDTGGTYTDAVVYDDHARVVVTAAKSPTTHDDLSIGITGAIDAALAAAAVDPGRIELVSLSTTLATNALVEGKGRPVGSLIIGFDETVVERGGLAEAIGADPAAFITGGHDTHGSEEAALDTAALRAAIEDMAPRVDAFAVMSQFSVRNPTHELAAQQLVRELTGRPVTCSHTLSAKLNGPKRAVTAILNARLIAIISELVATTVHTLATRGIDAPLMVVRGDGSLVSAEFVRDRPIETILSGPAASVVGAAHLTGLADAIVSDIGGTTTDVAVLRGGVPTVSDAGATVGGHHTMVSAVEMHTHGLGGDSQVRHDARAAGAVLVVGPRKVIPISQLALTHPGFVHGVLDRQLTNTLPGDHDGVIVLPARTTSRYQLSATEAALVERVGAGAAASDVVTTSMAGQVLARLVQHGFVRLAAFTPTDACHVLGTQSTYDAAAAHKAATVFARRRDRMGRPIAPDAATVARLTIDTLVRRSAEAVLSAAFVHDGRPASTATDPLVADALERRGSMVRMRLELGAPVVGLGASAPTYYPAVAELLGTPCVTPEHAGVANAVGAVVGRVRLSRQVVVTSPAQGRFLVHTADTPAALISLDAALSVARTEATAMLEAEMAAAGAAEFEWSERWEARHAEVEGVDMFVEGTLTVTGTGRPALR